MKAGGKAAVPCLPLQGRLLTECKAGDFTCSIYIFSLSFSFMRVMEVEKCPGCHSRIMFILFECILVRCSLTKGRIDLYLYYYELFLLTTPSIISNHNTSYFQSHLK